MSHSWKELIESNFGSVGDVRNEYAELLELHDGINKNDLQWFEEIILKALTGGNADYDMFPDDGGIQIAAVLLEEVKRLRK